MKKFNIFCFLSLFLLLPMMVGCQKDDIIFDIEMPRFETRPGYQLLEVIVPQATMPTDKIYITGPFNGGEEAIGNPLWELEKARDTNGKWGIYLDPKTFVDGKTLADGYTFVSMEQGEERSAQNQPVVHRDAPKVGGRLNVVVEQWADGFLSNNPGDIDHDGYVIYVVDNSGYDELTLYAWGDAEIFGGWPGVKATGTVVMNGVSYKYFDTGAANEGLTEHLIFNNNGGGKQLADFDVTLDQDYYVELTPDGVVPFDPSSTVEHDGYTIYVADLTGWDALYLYTWGAVNDLLGTWPGMSPTGQTTINGVKYTYFDLGEANINVGEQHIILNNGNGVQVDDVVVFNLDRDVYVELTATGATEIDPATYNPGTVEPPTPGPDPEEGEDYALYIENKTGWADFAVYAYGAKELFGGWPGAHASETKTIDGIEYLVFPFKGAGESYNLIFNVGSDANQYDALSITADKDYYIIAYPDKAELVK